MPTYTTNLRLTQPQAGDAGWGGLINTGVTLLVESALTGTTTVNVENGDYTLIAREGYPDEARSMFLRIVGAPTAPRNVICPSVPKLYFVRNLANHPVTIKTATGSGVAVAPTRSMIVQCDGQVVAAAIDFLPSQHYLHEQTVAASSWEVTHGMGKYPSVAVVDSTGEEVEGEVQYTGLNTLTIKFSAPFAGRAFFN